MSRHHELKIWPFYFDAVKSGLKNFEVRENDRNFQPGDTVTLKEWLPEPQYYSGEELTFQVGYVLSLNGFLETKEDYVVFSLLPNTIGENENETIDTVF